MGGTAPHFFGYSELKKASEPMQRCKFKPLRIIVHGLNLMMRLLGCSLWAIAQRMPDFCRPAITS
jgi:hypothetical protein